jgi:hypothetical protein
MLRKKIAVHFDLLVARGLNPHRITGDAEHDNQALFEYVLWQVTERNLLRMLGYPYDVSRRAVNCYIEHANRLHGLSPRRMALLAALFREDLPAQTLEVELAIWQKAVCGGSSRCARLVCPGPTEAPFNTGRRPEGAQLRKSNKSRRRTAQTRCHNG